MTGSVAECRPEPRRHRLHQIPAKRGGPPRARRLLQWPGHPGLALQVPRRRAEQRDGRPHNNKRLRDRLRAGLVARQHRRGVRVQDCDQGRGNWRSGGGGGGPVKGRDPVQGQQEWHVRRRVLSDYPGRLYDHCQVL